MPELPEVETTVKGLSIILYQKISNVKIHITKLRFKIGRAHVRTPVTRGSRMPSSA